ncbi:MAG: hypothetical protein HY847_13705 [Betaproteobacteria bacterium]|nr:hypothetical protein [Betaproteobacteria bacterium]
MEPANQFAQWVALLVNKFRESRTPGIQYTGVTPAACELLRAVDAGGVPAFVTKNLVQIAKNNGIEADSRWTPNEIVGAIRGKAGIDASERQKN